MNKQIALLLFLLWLPVAIAQDQPARENPLLERVAHTGFVRVDAESFKALDAKQQQLAYWLTQASIAIDPIVYDQFSRFGLRQKRLLEELVAHPEGMNPDLKTKIGEFAKLFWANRGNHNDITSQKFLPNFTFDEWKQAALSAQKKAPLRLATPICRRSPLPSN